MARLRGCVPPRWLLAAALAVPGGAEWGLGGSPAKEGAETTLRPYRWRRLATGVIRPRGWLETQARLQAGALTSHLPLFWPEVSNSSWLGGDADNDGGLHESVPYWLNGALPLALQLDDGRLLGLVASYLQGVLARQGADGWLGPDTDPGDFWSRFPMVLALVQYHEALPAGSEMRKKVLGSALAFFGSVEARLNRGVELSGWSGARVHDLIWAIHYFVDVLEAGEAMPPGAPGIPQLLRLATRLHAEGFDWHGAWFGNASAFPQEAVKDTFTMWTHGVNNAQAIKHGAVWARQAADAAPTVGQSKQAWAALMAHHGQPNGAFSADEHLAGASPSRGTELCAVVESMWSLALLAQASSQDLDAAEALDALELLAVNALPGGLSGDLWSHPYLQFANSYQARPATKDHVWSSTDGADAAMYGLAPNYECCTSNFHQGYPKLIAGLFYEVPARGALVSTLWLPSRLNTSSDIGGGAAVELRTEYPFGLSAEYVVSNPEAFLLQIRLPAFLREVAGPDVGLSTVRVWVEGHERLVELADGFLEFDIPAWPLPEPRVAVRLEWKASPLVRRGPAGAGQGASVFVGPLLLTPDLGETRKMVRRYDFEAADWDTISTRPWAYALPSASQAPPAQVLRRAPGAQPFGHGAAACPLATSAALLRLEAWGPSHNAPGPLPPPSRLRGSLENVTLLPYGCSSVHIAALPEVPLADQALSKLPNIIFAL